MLSSKTTLIVGVTITIIAITTTCSFAGETAPILCCPVPLDLLPPGVPREIYTKTGDLNIGGVFSIHSYSADGPCGKWLLGTVQTQFVEAMVYAIDQINANDSLLTNITLGYSILDDCNTPTTGLAQALALVPRNRNCSENSTLDSFATTPYDVIGVVGSMASAISIEIADLLSIFNLPQISAASTSDQLSSKERYPYFLRLTGTNRFQAKSIVDFIVHFNWTYISVIGSSQEYGATGASWVKRFAEDYGICIAYSIDVPLSAPDPFFSAIILSLRAFGDAKVVVVFASNQISQNFLRAARRAKVEKEFIFIFSDGVGSRSALQGFEDVALGAFFVKTFAYRVPAYDEYFTSLNPKHHQRNPWFLQFWEEYFDCTTSVDDHERVRCTFNETISHKTGYRQDVRVALFIDTVYTFAHGLHSYLEDHCTNVKAAHLLHCIQGPHFLKHLKDVSFYGQSGPVKFNEDGDRLAKFMIDHYVNVNGSNEFTKVAVWSQDKPISVQQESIQWQVDVGENGVPESICSKECPPGYRRVIGPVHCCWVCKKCRPNEITTHFALDCSICPLLTWPDDRSETCKAIEAYYMPWNDPLAITLSVLAVGGIIACLSIAAIFIKHRHERIIKATCLELSCVFLIGGCVGFQTVFWYIGYPHPIACVIRPVGANMVAAMTYAPLLAKTSRIYRIFCAGKQGIKRPRFISTRWQLFLTFILLCFQVSLTYSN